MSVSRKFLTASILLILLIGSAFAQSTAPSVRIISRPDQVIFLYPARNQTIKIEVFNSNGEMLFDSGAQPDGIAIWKSDRIQKGEYAYRITVTDPSGYIANQEKGSFLFDELPGLSAGNHIAVTAQARKKSGTDGGTSAGGQTTLQHNDGIGNVESGYYASVSGGYYNTASGDYASVSGGSWNGATKDSATVAGGSNNKAEGYTSFVGSGYNNHARGSSSVIGGGDNNSANGSTSTVGGGSSNVASADRSTVGGGVYNLSKGIYSTIGGGVGNQAQGNQAIIGGGYYNTTSSSNTTVGGGQFNSATMPDSTVGGGGRNTASGEGAVVAGGWYNVAQGYYSMVPGGWFNHAIGSNSFAAGYLANANHEGSFVWSDHSQYEFASTAINSFHVRATGGVRFVTGIDSTGAPAAGVTLAAGSGSWSSLSDRAAKKNIQPVNSMEILKKVMDLPIKTWSYKLQAVTIRHIGPMAQDFHSVFEVGEDDKHITSVDPDGVALAAIQALYQISQEKDREIAQLKQEKDREIAELKARLERLEKALLK